MCSHYEGVKDPQTLREVFQVEPPALMDKVDLWPGYQGLLIRRPREKESGDEAVPDREALAGLFGLVPHWATDLKICRSTYNARSETVAEKPSFRDAWKHAHHCIVPAEWIYEPDWRTGKAVPTRIQRKDGKPMGIAGLWGSNRKATGEEVLSFTMLTINADDHDLFKNFHKPQDEKRMVVILGEDQYDDWLDAQVAQSSNFMRQFPSQQLEAAADAALGRKSSPI
jgi:putative SOS response-associated peptidase YedK